MTLFLVQQPAEAVTIVADTSDYVTFRNDDGDWTIYERCVGTNTTDGVGPAYVAKYVTRKGAVAVDGVGQGGSGEFGSPLRGGIGVSATSRREGNPPYVDSDPETDDKAWNISVRRCAHDQGGGGVTSWNTPTYGVSSGGGTYSQDVWLGDGWASQMVKVR